MRPHRLLSAANIFTRPSLPWLRPTFFTFATTAFVDGNKRVGANAAITFLPMNHWEPDFAPDELADLVLPVASGAVAWQS